MNHWECTLLVICDIAMENGGPFLVKLPLENCQSGDFTKQTVRLPEGITSDQKF